MSKTLEIAVVLNDNHLPEHIPTVSYWKLDSYPGHDTMYYQTDHINPELINIVIEDSSDEYRKEVVASFNRESMVSINFVAKGESSD